MQQVMIHRGIASISRVMGTDMEISHPVEIFFDTDNYWEHQIVLSEAGARSTLKGSLRHDERWISHIGFSSNIYAVQGKG